MWIKTWLYNKFKNYSFIKFSLYLILCFFISLVIIWFKCGNIMTCENPMIEPDLFWTFVFISFVGGFNKKK
ncbi:MAG: hypothetical protein ACJA0T_003217 [Colwellia sp.]|jgi:hypothetical protein